MDPIKAAESSGPVIVGLPAGFMLDGATYARGGELGFDGIDFYAGTLASRHVVTAIAGPAPSLYRLYRIVTPFRGGCAAAR